MRGSKMKLVARMVMAAGVVGLIFAVWAGFEVGASAHVVDRESRIEQLVEWCDYLKGQIRPEAIREDLTLGPGDHSVSWEVLGCPPPIDSKALVKLIGSTEGPDAIYLRIHAPEGAYSLAVTFEPDQVPKDDRYQFVRLTSRVWQVDRFEP